MENETKKEEILEKSRKENKNGDEKEKAAQSKAYALGGSIGLLLCMVVAIIEETVFDRNTDNIWLIYTGMYFTISLVSYIETKKKLHLTLTVIFGICCTAFGVLYLLSCFGM